MDNSDKHQLKPLAAYDSARCFGAEHAELIFSALCLDEGEYFLDAGCGPGEYALLAAKRVGGSGRVIALDRDEVMIQALEASMQKVDATNIRAAVADLSTTLPLDDNSIDVCLISGVLHMPGLAAMWDLLFAELRRILRSGGRLAIVETDNAAADPDAPLHWRLSPQLLTEHVQGFGFVRTDVMALNAGRFLILFDAVTAQSGGALK